MVDFKDYYKVLGVPLAATEAEIKDAFKKLAKQYHPDASTGDEARFKEFSEAYEVLKDKIKRAKYDSMLRYRNNFDSIVKSKSEAFKYKNQATKDFTGFDSLRETLKYAEDELLKSKPPKNKNDPKFSDFFELLFGRQQEQQKSDTAKVQLPVRGDDHDMDIELSLEDAYAGTIRRIEISAANRQVRRLEVTIPAGVRDGNKIKIRAEGKPGQFGGPNGDLFLKVKLKEHPLYKLEGEDIHSELLLKPEEALLGRTKYITTLEGVLELVIPPNTQSGKILRLRGKGLKSTKDGIYGDHYVHTIIKIPDSPSSEELKLYEELLKITKAQEDQNQNE